MQRQVGAFWCSLTNHIRTRQHHLTKEGRSLPLIAALSTGGVDLGAITANRKREPLTISIQERQTINQSSNRISRSSSRSTLRLASTKSGGIIACVQKCDTHRTADKQRATHIVLRGTLRLVRNVEDNARKEHHQTCHRRNPKAVWHPAI